MPEGTPHWPETPSKRRPKTSLAEFQATLMCPAAEDRGASPRKSPESPVYPKKEGEYLRTC